jgi:hypothetical protein
LQAGEQYSACGLEVARARPQARQAWRQGVASFASVMTYLPKMVLENLVGQLTRSVVVQSTIYRGDGLAFVVDEPKVLT